ncbi:MAG: CDP-alcohol phosphatidyltransferase family protein [Candidatus Marinimicrobia bacterium]|jgi:CDP-diacylglycerol--glycerol-3-phosphate 3-phosphatidyltransferase|nr:CDP-alcohol phosphatidyltransferase family protein [Candidatus Neomarinimicrobiota bacterium]MDP6936156.1 CDP-alcohol phosphatidyltransferase family protein [Candidatus Neomarinimicrobiota bacterium]
MRLRHRKRIRKKRLATREDRIMTLANAISISRIFISIPLVLVLEEVNRGNRDMLYWAFILIIVIVVSDFLDGFVARKVEDITNFGKLIDPVADKVCMMVVMIYLIISFKLPFLLFFTMLAFRDIFLIIIGVYLMFSQEEVFQSNQSGKWFIGISALMMAFFVFKESLEIPEVILWSSYFVSLVLFGFSTFEYFKRYLNYFKLLENR